MLAVVCVFVSQFAWAAVDDMERQFFGATNVNAAIGNGGLTAAVSSQAELTVLRWPSPSYYEHLNYETSKDGHGPETGDYDPLPRLGAEANAGVFVALAVDTGTGPQVVFPRDWPMSQYWESEDTAVLVTEARSDDLGLTLFQRMWVDPERDVLVWRVEPEFDADSPITSLRAILFENMGPDYDPEHGNLAALGDDRKNDYGVLYDPNSESLLHFIPKDDTSDAMSNLVADGATFQDVVDFAGNLDEIFPEGGIFAAIGADRSVFEFHCGHDAVYYDGQAVDEPSQRMPVADAYSLLTDGGVGVSYAADGQVTAMLSTLALDESGATFYLAMGISAAAAKGALSEAKTAGWESLKTASNDYWSTWIGRATLPQTDEAAKRALFKRALMDIKVAQDRESGAIVASVSEQPPYSLDWVRDGAFLNRVLNMAGYGEMVAAHNDFYIAVQNKADDPEDADIAGSWDMNNWADGGESTMDPVIRWEIDEVAFGIWALFDPVHFMTASKQQEWLEKVLPNIRLAADFLLACKGSDVDDRLTCEAHEDDNTAKTSTLQGAVTAYFGLALAAKAATMAGEDALAEPWAARAIELRQAIDAVYWNEADGHYDGEPGPQGWALWPIKLHPLESERMFRQARVLMNISRTHLEKNSEGYFYLSKLLIGAAHALRETPDQWETLNELADILLLETPTPGTYARGEVFVTGDFNGDGETEFQARVAMPHVWSEALLVQLGYELYGPQLDEIAFDPQPDVADGDADGDEPTVDGDSLPDVDGDVEMEGIKTCHQECQCNQPLNAKTSWWLVIVVGLLGLWLSRRRVQG